MKKPTITSLQADLRAANDEAKGYMEQRSVLRDELASKEALLKQTRADFADLKQRLLAAETANQFMRGYLARVQEDDVVREELVTTGEPDGAQQLVPKRKPTQFPRPSDFTEPAERGVFADRFYHESGGERRPARHWISY